MANSLEQDTCSTDSSNEEDQETIYYIGLLRNRRKNRQKGVIRQYWVRPIFSQRAQQGVFHHLVQELRLADTEYHFRYLRMSKEMFDYIVSLVSPLIYRRSYFSRHRLQISVEERVALTLRYIATGNSQMSLAFSFRMG